MTCLLSTEIKVVELSVNPGGVVRGGCDMFVSMNGHLQLLASIQGFFLAPVEHKEFFLCVHVGVEVTLSSVDSHIVSLFDVTWEYLIMYMTDQKSTFKSG